jgi:hypothetical protein
MTGTFQGITTLQFTPDNQNCYAYSGEIQTDGTGVTFLHFNTNSEYIKAIFQTMATQNDSDVLEWSIVLNGIEIIIYNSEGRGSSDRDHLEPLYVIIPPFTDVKVIAKSVNGGNKRGAATMTGTVHGSIEQFDLEVKQ